jgi:hypothetical protein
MSTASVRDLARRMLAVEAANKSAVDAHVHEAVRVCEKLRVSLTRLTGADGFASLLRRALALAKVEVPSLQSIEVKSDCSVFEQLAADSRDGATDAGVAIIARLLGLLITFIGASLTVRLVGDNWPGALLDE